MSLRGGDLRRRRDANQETRARGQKSPPVERREAPRVLQKRAWAKTTTDAPCGAPLPHHRGRRQRAPASPAPQRTGAMTRARNQRPHRCKCKRAQSSKMAIFPTQKELGCCRRELLMVCVCRGAFVGTWGRVSQKLWEHPF